MKKLYILFFILLLPNSSLALIEVDITRGNLNPLPIAVSPLSIDKESKDNFKKAFNIGFFYGLGFHISSLYWISISFKIISLDKLDLSLFKTNRATK